MPQNMFSGIGTSEELGCTDSKKSLALTKKMQTAADMIGVCDAGDIQDVWAWVLRAFDMYLVMWQKMLDGEGNLDGKIMSFNGRLKLIWSLLGEDISVNLDFTL